MSSPVSIFLIAPSWLGDSIMSLPLVGFLTSRVEVRVTVVARKRVGRVYWGVEGVEDVVVLADEGPLRRIEEQRVFARRVGYSGAVVLPPSFSSALGPFLAGVGVRVGVRSDGRRFLLTNSVSSRGLREEHLSDNYLRLGKLVFDALGIPSDHHFATPRVRTFEVERKTIGDRLARPGAGVGGYVVVVPGAAYGPTKTWPAEKYRELVGRLSKETAVVLAGSAAERSLCSSIGDGAGRVLNLAGETTLGELMAVLEGARVVVANDSGAPHIAASLGVPTVVIFGSTSPRWTAPIGEEVHVLREPVPCSPCFRRRCPTELECYRGISVEMALETVRGAVKKSIEKRGLS